MAKIKRYTKADGGYHGELGFMCPGCRRKHFINDSETELSHGEPVWTFNGDFDKPTVRASILTWCWQYNPATKEHDIKCDVCHSFITDGTIQFLSDCMHELAGQTVELPELPETKLEPGEWDGQHY